MRHSRIVNEQVMGEVKDSVTDKSNNLLEPGSGLYLIVLRTSLSL